MKTYDVTEYGAVGDQVVDDADAIQKAIDTAHANKGGTVTFPPGIYLIGKPLELKGVVVLKGSGWSGGSLNNGSFIYCNEGFAGNALRITGRGSSVQDIGFVQRQGNQNASSFTPKEYDWTINVLADDVKITNVLLYNVVRGIYLSGKGRMILDGIYGQPLITGIEIENCRDVTRINNVHFWRFWSNGTGVRIHMQTQATGLISYKNDNPFYTNIFCIGYKVGMHFSGEANNNSRSAQKFKVVNADLDYCVTGILITGSGTKGHISNLSCRGDENFDTPNAVKVSATNCRIQCNNVAADVFNESGISVRGSGTVFTVDNVFINGWNSDNGTFSGIYAGPSTRVIVGALRWFGGGNGASEVGGEGDITIVN